MSKIHLSLSLTNPPRRVPIEVENGASAKDLFDVASLATKIPVTGMKLIFRGRIIANKNDEIGVMDEFKLEEGSVIHCMGKAVETETLQAAMDMNTSSSVSNSNAPSASTSGSTVTIPPPAAAASASASASTNSTTLTAALNKIKTSYSASDYKTALTTLSKLLSNVIQNPMEEKYRKVKNTNAAFQKRLGRLNGANDAILSIGFTAGGGGEEYVLLPSPDAWPKLLASKSTLDQALTDHDLQQAQQLLQQQQQQQQGNSPDMGFGGLPNFNMPNMGGGMGMPPGGGAGLGAGGMDPSTMSNMLSDPQALQTMLQNPMMQQMIQNHPQFANNPMMQEQMRMLANNPQMIQQMSRMMSDPSNMARMNAMMQNMDGTGAGAGGMNASGAGAGSGMDMNQQMEMMRQFAGASGANNATNTNVNNRNSANNNASGSNQQQNQSGNNNGSGGDAEMTEEEMLAEAIARSLREQ